MGACLSWFALWEILPFLSFTTVWVFSHTDRFSGTSWVSYNSSHFWHYLPAVSVDPIGEGPRLTWDTNHKSQTVTCLSDQLVTESTNRGSHNLLLGELRKTLPYIYLFITEYNKGYSWKSQIKRYRRWGVEESQVQGLLSHGLGVEHPPSKWIYSATQKFSEKLTSLEASSQRHNQS